jgi:hypothetical protein
MYNCLGGEGIQTKGKKNYSDIDKEFMAWEQFEKIVKDIEKDLKIDRMNMDEKSLQIPSIKHYWVAELYRTKIQIQKLEKAKKERMKQVQANQVSEIGLSKSSIMAQVNNDELIIKINDKLEELKIIVEYLEDAKYVLGRVTDDLKNRIELEKVERL